MFESQSRSTCQEPNLPRSHTANWNSEQKGGRTNKTLAVKLCACDVRALCTTDRLSVRQVGQPRVE